MDCLLNESYMHVILESVFAVGSWLQGKGNICHVAS